MTIRQRAARYARWAHLAGWMAKEAVLWVSAGAAAAALGWLAGEANRRESPLR